MPPDGSCFLSVPVVWHFRVRPGAVACRVSSHLAVAMSGVARCFWLGSGLDRAGPLPMCKHRSRRGNCRQLSWGTNGCSVLLKSFFTHVFIKGEEESFDESTYKNYVKLNVDEFHWTPNKYVK